MGNRAIVTVRGSKEKPSVDRYYLHWNGGPDTITPFCKALFENNVKDKITVEECFKKLDIRAEPVDLKEYTSDYCEENGHWTIDLAHQVLYHRKTDKTQNLGYTVNDFEELFNKYVTHSILESHREKTRENYWVGIQKELNDFLKGPTK